MASSASLSSKAGYRNLLSSCQGPQIIILAAAGRIAGPVAASVIVLTWGSEPGEPRKPAACSLSVGRIADIRRSPAIQTGN